MALRDQPYLPLYVQDVISDEKLIECSAEAHGVYFRLLCMLHKQETYGKIELKAKYKQNESKISAFGEMLRRQMPFDSNTIQKAIQELLDEKVMFIDGDFLCQKRMIKDCDISEKRALSGAEGGKKGRNSGTKRYYNEPGYLYLIYDKDDSTAFKVGISAEPEKRIKGIIRKTGRNNLSFRRKWTVTDMGESEQVVLDYFDDIRDGEWIFGDFELSDIENQIIQILNKSKTKANSEIENENANENDISSSLEKSEKPFLPKPEKIKTWRDSFEIYLSELMQVYDRLIIDPMFIKERERYHPTLDISLSLEKSVKDYWGTEAGWKRKKSKRDTDPDWKRTLSKALDLPSNQVRKQYETKRTAPNNTIEARKQQENYAIFKPGDKESTRIIDIKAELEGSQAAN